MAFRRALLGQRCMIVLFIGTLRADEAVENIQLRYLSLLCVEIRDRFAYANDRNCSGWSHDAVQTILKTSGAIVRHYIILGGCANLNLEVMLHELPARKPPGRPRKKIKGLVRDRVRQSQHSMDALIRRLVDKPASVINWMVLMVKTTATEDGKTTERRGGYCDVAYEDEAILHHLKQRNLLE
ncbi:Hypothetical protein PHPALM_19864 [Phytophthora palmivora]|uniref:Uncharacterized protein n=1 Tax=Phytophthora palmivora TaxID=4796 RepID=A0A2P4XGB0_9STRA|nr:Hypothetical protein PHPALM_19864 [Phytophthora palmivora]